MISFFTRTDMGRLSSRIRGEELAHYLRARFNPTSGYEQDVCIWVKPGDMGRVRNGDYVDFLDGGRFSKVLKYRPEVKVIAASLYSYVYLKDFLKNPMVYIPQHHLNYDRLKRERNEIKMAGYIGGDPPVAIKQYQAMGQALKKIGWHFITCFNFKNRQEAIDLYRKIDLLIIAGWEWGDVYPFKIPTKLINAFSFGIPVIAYPLKAYQEIEGDYVPINNLEELLAAAEQFKDPEYYNQWPDKLMKVAEPYHISHIAEKFKELT